MFLICNVEMLISYTVLLKINIVIESIKLSAKSYPYLNSAFLGDACKIFINN